MDNLKYLATIAVCIVILALLAVFMPDTVLGILGEVESITKNGFDIKIAMEDLDINLNYDFEMPNFKIDFDDAAKPIFDISVVVIIVAILAVVLSCFFAPIGIITTGFFSYVAIRVAIEIMEVYKSLVANGNTTWQAASTCYLALFIALWLSLSASTVGMQGAIFGSSKGITKILLSLVTSIIGGALYAAVGAGLAVVVLGLGWAGGALLFAIIGCVLAILSSVGSTILAQQQ